MSEYCIQLLFIILESYFNEISKQMNFYFLSNKVNVFK